MTISMHAASVPVFQQMLGSLDALLVKMNNSASALSSLQTNYQKS